MTTMMTIAFVAVHVTVLLLAVRYVVEGQPVWYNTVRYGIRYVLCSGFLKIAGPY